MVLSIGDEYKGGIVSFIDLSNQTVLLVNPDFEANTVHSLLLANALANQSTTNGYSDWRLPSGEEIQYIRSFLYMPFLQGEEETYGLSTSTIIWVSDNDGGYDYAFKFNQGVFQESTGDYAYYKSVRTDSFGDEYIMNATDAEGDLKGGLFWDPLGGIGRDYIFNVDMSDNEQHSCPIAISPEFPLYTIPEISVGSKLPISDLDSDNEVDEEEYEIRIEEGWNSIGYPFNISTISKIRYVNSSGVEQTLYLGTDFSLFSITDKGETYDSLRLSTLFSLPHNEGKITIVKDSGGRVWLPEFGFEGIPSILSSEGNQMKALESFSVYVTAKPFYSQVDASDDYSIVYGKTIKALSGWTIMNYPLSYASDVVDAFSGIVENLLVVKNNSGLVYFPEWNFNGIGDLTPGESYLIKTKPLPSGQDYYEIEFL